MQRFRLLPTVSMIVLLAGIVIVMVGFWQRTATGTLSFVLTGPKPARATALPRGAAETVIAPVEKVMLPTPPVPTVTTPPTSTPTPTPTPMPLFQPAQPSVTLTGMRHEWQTWNNCGPATVAMDMSYFGSAIDQAQAGAVLRLSPDDKNVSPEELAVYAQSQGYVAALMVNGSTDLARTLLSNGVPVLVETWHEDEPDNGMGHYRLLAGYDDTQQNWIVYDSYDHTGLVDGDRYMGLRMPYAKLDAWWKVFNRTYVLVYPPQLTPMVEGILAAYGAVPTTMWTAAAAQAQTELAANGNDAFAWFNLGSSLAAQGRYDEATAAFDQARTIGLPWRMLWYQFGPFEAYLATGRAQDVVALADIVNAGTTSIEEIHYWRGRGLAAQENQAGARQAFEQALALNPTFAPAQTALAAIGE